MAIQTVTNANLADYVAERTSKGSKIATGEQEVAAADAAAPNTDGTPTPGHPVIKPGVAETLNSGPDPGNAQPTAKEKTAKNGVQDRIDELTRLRKEAEEFAEDEYTQRLRAEHRIGELEAEVNALKPKAAVEPRAEELKRPSPKDFTDQDAYDRAMDAYDAERDTRIRQQAVEQGRADARMAAQNELMSKRIDQAKKDLPDYQEVIEAASKRTTVIPPHIQAAFVESEVGPYLAYELAKDAQLEKRIFSLTPAKALLELGKLEQTLAKAPVTNGTTAATLPTPETTRAPAPVTPVKGGDGEIRTDLSKPMAFAEYKAARLEKMRKQRRH